MATSRSLVLVALLVGAAQCADISRPLDGVAELTTKNFKKSVRNGNHWLVEFYAPWCSWCKKLVPEWRLLGQSVKGNPKVSIGKVNTDTDGASDITDLYDVKGFPTIVLIRPDGKWKKYTGKRTTQDFLDFIKVETDEDMSVKVFDEDRMTGGTGVVQVVTSKTFQPLVLDGTIHTFLKFYAPWCSHCKAMEDDWKRLAALMKDRKDIVIAEVDGEKYRDVGDKAKVGSFPTLKLFTKRNKRGIDFKGPRTVNAMRDFLESNAKSG
eukprot:TRINITY_DN27951_c0_g1_i1.p1 TRINITY_DN27951_c0_g1~~TRINITY_DN27951_c0_g1_i1.p1  ORF type:complete len:266 (+),score=107.20 TRINITY_DN27951_c0_g1_i1:107-904(+)